MSVRVDTAVIGEMKRFGAFDVNQCFHCGNCTAVCPLSQGTDSFPRRMIRYSQIGDKQRLLASKELWLCYYCGECSDTCPRQAEPGEFMAAARRYAIASLDPTGISRLLYTSKWFAAFFLAALRLVLALGLLARRGDIETSFPALFQFIPFEVVPDLGLVAILIAALAMAAGSIRLFLMLWRAGIRPASRDATTGQPPLWNRVMPALRGVTAELGVEKRYRDCEAESPAPWHRSRWFMHWAIM